MKFSVDEIQHACRILDLPDRANISLIKEYYRNLSQKWHPDICKDASESETKMKEINWAYRLLMEYCTHYLIDFSREELEKNRGSADWWLKQFGNDPIWGPGKE